MRLGWARLRWETEGAPEGKSPEGEREDRPRHLSSACSRSCNSRF